MKLTKQQQVLGGVMIAGLIAVSVDRFMPKAAANTASADVSEIAIEHTEPTSVAMASRTPSFNQRLTAAVSTSDSGRGAFEVGRAWQAAQPTVVAIDPAIEQFARTHRLSATLARAERDGAIVDGKLLIVGQVIDGFKLISVTSRSASFANATTHITLNQVGR